MCENGFTEGGEGSQDQAWQAVQRSSPSSGGIGSHLHNGGSDRLFGPVAVMPGTGVAGELRARLLVEPCMWASPVACVSG